MYNYWTISLVNYMSMDLFLCSYSTVVYLILIYILSVAGLSAMRTDLPGYD